MFACFNCSKISNLNAFYSSVQSYIGWKEKIIVRMHKIQRSILKVKDKEVTDYNLNSKLTKIGSCQIKKTNQKPKCNNENGN